ncbi:hypothetical protein [Mycobacterium paraffinicum]|nr:hypothetical protein [Mycobacterium paraffinicum]
MEGDYGGQSRANTQGSSGSLDTGDVGEIKVEAASQTDEHRNRAPPANETANDAATELVRSPRDRDSRQTVWRAFVLMAGLFTRVNARFG